ncbi:MAG: EAL domain-containing protein [Gammaproteobacteria bacterium]|nr:EAL domain-containing protein [Gammaproteobacteria bacterium]
MNILNSSKSRSAGGNLLIALLYFVSGHLSLLLAIPPGYATAVWPGAGIALAALLLYGGRFLPGVILGSFLTNLSPNPELLISIPTLKTASVAFVIALGAGAQALLGAKLVQRFFERDPGLLELRNIVALLVLGGPVSCLLNSTWGVATLVASGLIDLSEYGYSWMTWWVGDSIGVLIFVPIVFIFSGRPREVWIKRRFTVTLPLLLFFSLVVIGFIFASHQEQQAARVAFARNGEAISESLDKQMVRYLEVVHAIQSYFAGSSEVSRKEFRTFVSRTLERVPGIQALSWNPRISAAERPAYEETARRDGFVDFRIWQRDADGNLIPASDRPEYVAVYYIEPYAGNEGALGYDVYSQPERRTAIDVARDNGEAVVTPPITLVQEEASQTGVLVFVPIYRTEAVPATIEERRAGLLGYAVGVFRLGDVLATALDGVSVTDLLIQLSDNTDEENPEQLAYARLDDHGKVKTVSAAGPAASQNNLHYLRHHEVAGRVWQLRVTADNNYLTARRSWTGWWVLSGGLSFAGLFGLFLLALTGRWLIDERRAEELAISNINLTDQVAKRIRTEKALHAEKERAEVTLHSIGDAVITTDANGDIEYLNPVAENLTEWSADEARGRPLKAVFRIVNEETREPVIDPVQRCCNEGRVIGLANHTVLISRTGREYAIQDSAAPIRDYKDKLTGVVLVFNDVSESRRMAREAAHHATHDTLTGLVNRREFDRRLEQALASSKQYGTRHAICYLDLDQFKIVNDTCGHRAGDELLKHISHLLANEVRERDTLARLGGDEFGLLLDNCPIEKAFEIAETLVSSVRDYRFVWDEQPFDIGVSIGVVAIAGQVETAEVLLSHADVACYAAKDLGRNRVHVYQPDFSGADPHHREILRLSDMRSAIEQNRFRLYGQPIFSLEDETPKMQWCEVLLRMIDQDNNLVLPGSFVPVAERFDHMDQIDRWVIRTVFRDYKKLFPDESQANLAINLSGNLLGDDKLLPFLREQFDTHEIDPERVCFEVTETAAIRNISAATQLINAIREIGGKFALDDFGSGLSSFAYLKSLPVNYIKIDGKLVRRIAEESGDRAMVEAVNQLAHRMGMQTVAEYVETPECIQVLREIGVDYAQGFALAKPDALPLATARL